MIPPCRLALERVLAAYDEYLETDVLDPLAEAIGEARIALTEEHE